MFRSHSRSGIFLQNSPLPTCPEAVGFHCYCHWEKWEQWENKVKKDSRHLGLKCIHDHVGFLWSLLGGLSYSHFTDEKMKVERHFPHMYNLYSVGNLSLFKSKVKNGLQYLETKFISKERLFCFFHENCKSHLKERHQGTSVSDPGFNNQLCYGPWFVFFFARGRRVRHTWQFPKGRRQGDMHRMKRWEEDSGETKYAWANAQWFCIFLGGLLWLWLWLITNSSFTGKSVFQKNH
jgi:hypothetical protein